jgi:hypothetical protein
MPTLATPSASSDIYVYVTTYLNEQFELPNRVSNDNIHGC